MQFSDNDRASLYRVIQERRDIRHFTSDPVDPATLNNILHAGNLAPSVGLMQPWRLIRITSQPIRQKIVELVETERIKTAQALQERQDEFLRLKVEGIKECGELIVVCLMDQRDHHVFGRRTMPEMDLASVACAIQNMWLAARAENLGMGWVSLFDPQALGSLLNIPTGAKAIAILCLGHVPEFYPKPMLEQEGWACRQPLTLYHNQWLGTSSTP